MLRTPIAAIRWWNEWWSRRERYWKGAYYTFAIAFVFFSFVSAEASFLRIVLGAASLSFSVGAGFWLSDRFNRRMDEVRGPRRPD